MKKKLCVVTGSRAEYGLFVPLLQKIKKEPMFQLQIAVTGTHLSSIHGLTYKEILRDGFKIDEKVKIPLGNDTPEGIARAVAATVVGLAAAFKRLKPDFVVLLGDRFETYSAAISAFLARIPIIHLYGGELTEGAIDDAFRHSISKMSLLHFTSTEAYRKRVIQLGEAPQRVFNVGALGIDNIRRIKLLSREALEKELNFDLKGKTALVTFHPVTLENNTSGDQFKEVLLALDHFKDLKVVFTKPNADTHSKVLIGQIDHYVKSHAQKAVAFTSLGTLRYLSLMKHVDVMLGNSSSGIIEMPSFGKPTINVGDRQKGRLSAGSVIHCAPIQASVFKALKKSLSRKFSQKCLKIRNPYDSGIVAKKVISILKKEIPWIKDLKKKFYDIRQV